MFQNSFQFPMKKFTQLLGVALLSLCVNRSVAQVKIIPRWEAGISGGRSVYQGDLTPYMWGNFEESDLCFSAFVRHYIYPTVSWRGQVSVATIKANESRYWETYRQLRAFKFSSTVTELSFLMEWEPFGDQFGKRFSDPHPRGFKWKNMYFSPYIFAGPALDFVSPTLDLTNTKFDYFGGEFTPESIKEDANASKIALMIPAGLGFKFDFGYKVCIFAEATARLSFTDNLDGVNKSSRGSGKDSYYNYNFGICYRFKQKDMWTKMYGERNRWVKEKYEE